MAPTLIYCAGGNRRFYEIATNTGFQYGARLPDTVYGPLFFADQNWKTPNRERYMIELDKYRPIMATVLDWEEHDQLPEVLSWAEEAAQYVTEILIIPKVIGGIEKLPRTIGNKPITLAYSVPTRYGGTTTPVWEFDGWPVHLLGGSPHKQWKLSHYLDVKSLDGNMMMLLAVRHCQFWVPGTARYADNRWWPTLREANSGERWPGIDAPYEAFKRSCENIWEFWHR